MENEEIKEHLTDKDAERIGDYLGYREGAPARRAGRRFYSHLKGEITNYRYNDTVHWGDIAKTILPILSYLKQKGYRVEY